MKMCQIFKLITVKGKNVKLASEMSYMQASLTWTRIIEITRAIDAIGIQNQITAAIASSIFEVRTKWPENYEN